MKTDKLNEQKALGVQAEFLLNNALLKDVFTSLRDEALAESYSHSGSRPDDIAIREYARLRAKSVDDVRTRLESLLANGKQAMRDLGQIT